MAAILTAFTTWATSFATDALSVIEDALPVILPIAGGMIALGLFLKVVRKVTGR